jgi:hypothetical protein
MCPTPLGRLHTRVAIIAFLPALLGLVVSLATQNPRWIALIGLYLLLGVSLDAVVYSWALRYQPPWMTFVLAVVEFGLLLALAKAANLGLPVLDALWLYWASWILAIWTKIALLPLLSLTYLESAGEFRHAQWSVPPAQVSLALIAAMPPAAPQTAPGAVEREPERLTL